MADWHIGQMVVCVDARPHRAVGAALSKGSIYTIRALADDFDGVIYCRLEEVLLPVNPFTANEFGWGLDRFRPVKPTSIEVFRKLLAPIEELVGK